MTAEPSAPFDHRTRTTLPTMRETGAVKRRRAYPRDRSSSALCSCGWMQAHDRRDAARDAARHHRETGDYGRWPYCQRHGEVTAAHFPCPGMP